jgi:uncharacterized OsmC-like protein
MNAIATKNRTDHSEKVESRAAPSGALFVSPHERRDGFWASIRGHVLDLADPSSGHALAPTPNDLFIVSIASDLAWTARSILRTHGLPDDVSVSATWRTQEHGDRTSLSDITLTVTVSARAKAARAALAAALENILEARSLAEPIAHISWEGANR